jgi:UDP-N-acetylmuramoyl-tripeptide--D-alanyl-D-alanine ligase
MQPVKGRLQLKRAQSGATIIDDSYNANPSSVRAGIDVLAELDGRHWLVFGDMAELGDFAQAAHEDIGRYARECGIERMFAIGPLASRAVETFGIGGEWFAEPDSLVRVLSDAGPEVRMLIKGSRVNRLERVVEALVRSDNLREAG